MIKRILNYLKEGLFSIVILIAFAPNLLNAQVSENMDALQWRFIGPIFI